MERAFAMNTDRHTMSSLQIARMDSDERLFQKAVESARVLKGESRNVMGVSHYCNVLRNAVQVIAERLNSGFPDMHRSLIPFGKALETLTREEFADINAVAGRIVRLDIPQEKSEIRQEPRKIQPANPFSGLKL